ncbi:MAG: hypothetical protein FJZ59_03270 [Chlamydiae bacterium]|nr:hypothetical protein [Chlamydiota bacterium]
MTSSLLPPAGSPHSSVRLLKDPLELVPTVEEAYEVTGESRLSDIKERIQGLVESKIGNGDLARELTTYISDSIHLMQAEARETIHFLKMKTSHGYNITVLFKKALPVRPFDITASASLQESHSHCFHEKVISLHKDAFGPDISAWSFHFQADAVKEEVLKEETKRHIVVRKEGSKLIFQIQKTIPREVLTYVLNKNIKNLVEPKSAIVAMTDFLTTQIFQIVEAADPGTISIAVSSDLSKKIPFISIFSKHDFPLTPFSIDPSHPLMATHEVCLAKETQRIYACDFAPDLKRFDFPLSDEAVLRYNPLLREIIRVREKQVVHKTTSLEELTGSLLDLLREKLEPGKIELVCRYLAFQLRQIKEATPNKGVYYNVTHSKKTGWTVNLFFSSDAYNIENPKGISPYLRPSDEIPIELQGNFDVAISHTKLGSSSPEERLFLFMLDGEKLASHVEAEKRARDTRASELSEMGPAIPKGAFLLRKEARSVDIKYVLSKLLSGLPIPEELIPSFCYYLASEISRLRVSLNQTRTLENMYLYINNDPSFGLSLVTAFPKELRSMMVPFATPKHAELLRNYSYNFSTERKATLYEFGRFDPHCSMIFGLYPTPDAESTIPRDGEGLATKKRQRV